VYDEVRTPIPELDVLEFDNAPSVVNPPSPINTYINPDSAVKTSSDSPVLDDI
jgi:hypothetical protein